MLGLRFILDLHLCACMRFNLVNAAFVFGVVFSFAFLFMFGCVFVFALGFVLCQCWVCVLSILGVCLRLYFVFVCVCVCMFVCVLSMMELHL